MSLLKKANAAFRNKKYLESIELYEQAIKKQPQIKGIIDFNLNYAQKKIGINSSQVRKEKVSQPVPSVKKNIIESYEGKLEVNKNNLLRGWAVQTGNPSAIFELTVNVNGIEFCKIKNDKHRNDLVRHKKSTGRGGFSLHLPKELFAIDFNKLEIKYPNGQLLADLPIPEQPSLGMYHSVRSLDQAKVSVIVPVYNASDDLKVCVERLIKYTSDDTDVILIDDASPDPEIQSILKQAQQYENIRIFKNEHNLGFTGTINRGIELAGKNDVVFLNSDARVTPKWLEGLKAALATDPKIATVTPMSDRAGAFSAPNIGNENPLPEGVTEEEYAIAFRRRSVGVYPKVPTGNGFCLYVRRKCINEIGSLDAEAFPRGYGEENDFCMRALRSGWSHIIDDRTYIFHDRSKSFGEAKTDLMAAGRAVVDERYPEYKLAIPIFSTDEKIGLARYCARLALQDCINNHRSAWVPRVLYVVATQTGGTPQTNRDLMGALSDVLEGWLLRSNSEVLELSRMDGQGQTQLVRSHQLQEPVDPLTHNSSEYDRVVSGWLQEFDFNLVHIRHLGWHGLSLPRLANQLAVKVIYSFHDFYALSSHFKLIDDEGVFLGNKFNNKGSIYRESLWPKDALPTPCGNWLAYWRDRFQSALEYCDAFVTTSESARRLILDAMPRIPANRFVVIPHGRDFPCFSRIRTRPKPKEPIRILVPGHINAVKGLEIIRALTEYDKAGKLEFHILGQLIGDPPEKGIVPLGVYDRDEFAEKASAVRPHLGIMFSVWDETYCHTLTELWSVGLPVAVLDFPNVADRVRRSGAGWVLDHQDIPKLYNEILRIAHDEQEYERTEQALTTWQEGYGLANSTAQMAAGYLNIYSDVLCDGSNKPKSLSPYKRKRIAVVNLDARDFAKPADANKLLFSQTKNSIDRNIIYIRMSPSMLLASGREKMVDGAIIEGEVLLHTVEAILNELSELGIPHISSDKKLLKNQNPIAFDKALNDALNENKLNKNPALRKSASFKKRRIAVFVHVFYLDVWKKIADYLKNIKQEFDLFITYPEEKLSYFNCIKEAYPNAVIMPTENRGMDVLPFLRMVYNFQLWEYDAVLKLHTKNNKSELGEVLGKSLLEGVLGTENLVEKILYEIQPNSKIGMIGSECMYRSALKLMKPNRAHAENIIGTIPTSFPDQDWGFFAGTMFWIYGPLLEKIMLNYDQLISDAYNDESIAVTGSDGSWAHAMERIFGLLPVIDGKGVAVSFPSTENGEHTHIRHFKSEELSFNRISSCRSTYFVNRYNNLSEWVNLCRNSNFFDESYYRRFGGDLVPSEMDAATHYVLFGDLLGLNPSCRFSSKDYLNKYKDVAHSLPSIPSLVHYLEFGKSERRIISAAIPGRPINY